MKSDLNSSPPFTGMEIISTRTFDQSRDTVFGAFAHPAHLARWWGPKGFRNTIKTFDFRSGGAWRYVMHSPDGTDYDNASNFHEVVAPERIVLEHLGPMHRFLMTMTYEDLAGKTRLTWRMQFEAGSENAAMREFLSAANQENFDRLAQLLQSEV